MNRMVLMALLIFGGFLAIPGCGLGANGKIAKVLPHVLDQQGRHTLYPSLFERDAYQHQLQQAPNEQSGIRFDIKWKVNGSTESPLKLKVTLRGSEAYRTEPLTLTKEVHSKGWFGTWSRLPLTGKPFEKMGKLMAWRVTLWHGDKLLDEQTSFLWTDIIAAENERTEGGDKAPSAEVNSKSQIPNNTILSP